jgi:bla regulator protein blaR1
MIPPWMMRHRATAAAITVFLIPVSIALMISPRVRAQQATGVILGTPPPGTAGDPGSVSFEVASVKPNKSGDGRVMISMPPTGRYTATNVPARLMIQQSYGLQPFQIVGGPAWMTSDRFDIVAKAPDGFAPDQIRGMVRALLADRFKFKAHMETREMPIYALMLAKSDGKLGPNLKTSTTDCAALAKERRAAGPPPVPQQPGEPIQCGFMVGAGNMNAGGMPMTELARSLSGFVNRIVIDKTGLTGNYDFQLAYTPDGRGGGPLGPLAGAPPIGADAPAADPNRPSLFTALQEQLGLKLDSQKGPVEVLVIDSIEQPTED